MSPDFNKIALYCSAILAVLISLCELVGALKGVPWISDHINVISLLLIALLTLFLAVNVEGRLGKIEKQGEEAANTGRPYTQAEWGSPVLVTGSYSYTGINAGPGGVFSGPGSGTGGAGPVFSGAGGVNLGGGRRYGTGYGMGGSVAGYSPGAYASLLSAALSAGGMFGGGGTDIRHAFDAN